MGSCARAGAGGGGRERVKTMYNFVGVYQYTAH